MKINVVLAFTFIPLYAYAVDEYEVRAAYARLNSACKNNVSSVSQMLKGECLAARKDVDAVTGQLHREIANSIEAKARERQRIQQEELWRQEVRRQGGW